MWSKRCIRLIMPRVVADQREKFESDELFKKLSRETEVRYIGSDPELDLNARIDEFKEDVQTGYLHVAFMSTGTHVHLTFPSGSNDNQGATSLAAAVEESHSEVSQQQTGPSSEPSREFRQSPYRDSKAVVDSSTNKVTIVSYFIMDGVCVRWTGWLSLTTLEGYAKLEFDEQGAQVEDTILRSQLGEAERLQAGGISGTAVIERPQQTRRSSEEESETQ